MIKLQRVSKWFGDVVALSDVTFTIGPGVTALLGPNGAGKSTALRIMCGLTRPSQGECMVLDAIPGEDVSLYRRLGLVPQQESVFRRLTGLEFVRLAAVLHGVAGADAVARRALGLVELDADDRRPMRAYSKGMRQRAKIAHAIVHSPDVVVLDEPLNGLDPRQRTHMVGLFRRLGEQGRCVVVSSHVLDEVERFGSKVLVLAQGRLVAEGDFHAIRDLLEDRPHQLRLRASDPRKLAAELLAAGTVSGARVEGTDTLVVESPDVRSLRVTVAGAAKRKRVRLYEMSPLDDDLESVFRYLISRG